LYSKRIKKEIKLEEREMFLQILLSFGVMVGSSFSEGKLNILLNLKSKMFFFILNVQWTPLNGIMDNGISLLMESN
jgi:hypothetical protein